MCMKRLLFVFSILLLAFVSNANAQKHSFGYRLYWEFSSDGTLTISGNGEIPSYFDRRTTKVLDTPWESELKKINRIVLCEGITSIGNYAFSASSVQSVELPKTIRKIGFYAFYRCNNLLSIELPEGLISIGNNAFGQCEGLKSIEIPNTVTDIGEGAFYDCKSLSFIKLPNSIKEIKDLCFSGNKCRSIIIPNSVTRIGENAFSNCWDLEFAYIPNSVTFIGKMAFYGCKKLKEIALPPSVVTIESLAFSGAGVLVKDKMDRIKIYAKNNRYQHFFHNNTHDGYYLVDEEGEKGLLSFNDKWVIPLGKEYSEINYAGGNYLKVKNNIGLAIIDFEGKVILSADKKYKSISDYDSKSKTFSFTKIGLSGTCNAAGQVISTKKIPLTDSEIKQIGGYANAVEIKNGSTKYYKVSKGGRYGLTNTYGKEIVPCEMEALESAGTGYLKYKINGFWGVMNYAGKILIGTDRGYTSIGNFVTFTKRFPYTMTGYKGECDINGQQISKIKVETPKQAAVSSSSSSSSSSNNNNSGNKTTTVVVEHHRDPVPVQEWQQCTNCWGEGKVMCLGACGGTGTYYVGDRLRVCSSCNGTGKKICPYCSGQGGKNVTVYR